MQDSTTQTDSRQRLFHRFVGGLVLAALAVLLVPLLAELDPAGGDVLAGDLAIGGILIGGIVRLRHARKPPFEDDPMGVRRSLVQLLDRGATRFHVGHGGPLTAAAVRSYIAREPRLAPSRAAAPGLA